VNILIFNVGSSSLRYAFFQDDKKVHEKRIESKNLKKDVNFILKNIKEKIDIIAHRVVHGKDNKKPLIINSTTIKELKKYSEFTPLHQPHEIKIIELCKPYCNKHKIKQIAVFDTLFYKDLPELAKIYPIPKQFKIRRYGFHGLSHTYIAKMFPGNIISCHLGNGSSITAIKDRKPLDTSMGFTPLEGIVMGTRPGSIDPGIILSLFKQFKNYKKVEDILYNKSGLLAISGFSNDFRDLKKSKKGDFAIEYFKYSLIKQICAYQATLEKIDKIVFTGEIAINNPEIMNSIMASLQKRLRIKSFAIIKTDEALIIKEEVNKFLKN